MTKYDEAHYEEICVFCMFFVRDLGNGVCNNADCDHYGHYLHIDHPACPLFQIRAAEAAADVK